MSAELTMESILEAKSHLDNEPAQDIFTLFYGGYQGIPLRFFPKGIKSGDVLGSFRHVKVKKI